MKKKDITARIDELAVIIKEQKAVSVVDVETCLATQRERNSLSEMLNDPPSLTAAGEDILAGADAKGYLRGNAAALRKLKADGLCWRMTPDNYFSLTDKGLAVAGVVKKAKKDKETM